MVYTLTVLYSQLFVTLPYPTSDFTNQVIIVTGSNTGLGLEAVKHLIRLNAAHVILAIRSTAQGAAAVQHIITTTQYTPKHLSIWPLDLSSYKSIKAFGERVRRDLGRLDAVIQNAGVLTSRWAFAKGNESHITKNVVGPLLLGLEVLPTLPESARKTGLRGRLAFNGSDTHYVARFAEKDRKPGASLFDALNDEETADMDDR